MTEKSKINVAVQGSGMSAKTFHLPLLESLPEQFNIHTIISRSLKSPLERYPNAKVIAEIEDVLKDSEINLVVITGPNSVHYKYAKAVIEAGKNVVVEKPFTVTSQQALDLAELVKTKKVLCAVYHNRRFDSDLKTVQKVIPSLGDLVEFESNYDRFRPSGKGGWREDAAEGGSGILYDLGSHLIDQALYLFGIPNSVTAFVKHQRGLKTDDYFVISLHYQKGPIVTLRSGCLYPHARPRFLVHGTKASFIKSGLDVQEDQLKAGRIPSDNKTPSFGVEPNSLWGTIYDGQSGKGSVVNSEKGTYVSFYENVAKGIQAAATDTDRTEAVGLVSAKLAAHVIQIIELAKQSSDEGKTIAIPA